MPAQSVSAYGPKVNYNKGNNQYDQRQGLYGQRGLGGSMPSALNTSSNNNSTRVPGFQSLSVLNVNVSSTQDDNGNRFNAHCRPHVYAPDKMTHISTSSSSNNAYHQVNRDYDESFNHIAKHDHHSHDNGKYYHLSDSTKSKS